MKKLMIATPAQGGLVDINYAFSLAQTLHHLAMNNISSSIVIRQSGSLIISERNNLLWHFYNSDCSHMLCIDADIGWDYKDVLRWLEMDKELIAGCYLAKGDKGFLFRPITYEHIDIEKDGLILAKAVPFGFVMLSRECLSNMIEAHRDLYYKSIDGKDEGYGLFNTCVKDQQFWGEDYSFCLRAWDAGVQLWIDPYVELTHAGKKGKLIDDLLEGQNDGITRGEK